MSENNMKYPGGHFSSIEKYCPQCGSQEYNVIGIQVVRGTLMEVDGKAAIVDLSHAENTWVVDPLFIQCNECNLLVWDGEASVMDNLGNIVR